MQALQQSVMKFACYSGPLADARLKSDLELMLHLQNTPLVGHPKECEECGSAKNEKPVRLVEGAEFRCSGVVDRLRLLHADLMVNFGNEIGGHELQRPDLGVETPSNCGPVVRKGQQPDSFQLLLQRDIDVVQRRNDRRIAGNPGRQLHQAALCSLHLVTNRKLQRSNLLQHADGVFRIGQFAQSVVQGRYRCMDTEYRIQLLLDPRKPQGLGSDLVQLPQNETIRGEHGQDDQSKPQDQATASAERTDSKSPLCETINGGPEPCFKLRPHRFYLSAPRSFGKCLPSRSVVPFKGGPGLSPVMRTNSFSSAAAASGA